MSRLTLPLITFAILCGGCIPTAAQTVWVPQASGTDDGLTGVTYGGGQFVAVGDPGVIVSSSDSVTWTTQVSGTTEALRGIAHGDGLFVATGAAGTALTSSDGVTWTAQNARTSRLLSGATFGDGKFVAVGGSGTVRYSSDGVSWDLGILSSSAALQGICYGGGKFVAVGSSGTIAHSTDGQFWTLAATGPQVSDYFFSASYLNGTYVAVGQNGAVLTSTDAIDWTRQEVVAFTRLRSITNNGKQFVAVGDPVAEDSFPGKVLTSMDGANWVVTDVPADVSFNSISYGSETYVIAGEATGAPLMGLLLTSEDDLATSLSFEDWRQAEFTAPELADPIVSGAGADPDCDGIPNFVEYALGLPPKALGGHNAGPQLAKSNGGGAAISFMRPVDRVGAVTYSVTWSSDLSAWIPLNGAEEVVSEEAGFQTVKFTDSDSSAVRKFYKVVFSGG